MSFCTTPMRTAREWRLAGLLSLITVVLAGSHAPVCGQANVTTLLTDLSRQAQSMKSLTGTIHREERSLVGTQIWEDHFQFTAPGAFRANTKKISGEGAGPEQVSIAVGNESWLLIPATRTARHWGRNLFRQWIGMVGGPANVAEFLTQANTLTEKYNARLLEGPPIQNRATTVLELSEKSPDAPLVRDVVRQGGGYPLTVYGVFKRPRYLQPPRARLYFDRDTLTLLRREHYDEQGRIALRAECLETRKFGEMSFPAVWEVSLTDPADRGGRGVLQTRLEYRNVEMNSTVLNSVFDPPLTDQMMIEEQEPRTIADWRQRVAANPGDPHAHYNLALTLLRHTEDVPAARNELNEAIKLRPGAIAPWLIAADIYGGNYYLDESLEALRKAMTIESGNATIYGLAAAVLFEQGQQDEARVMLQCAVGKEPRNPHWRLLLGELNQQLGRIEEAAKEYVSILGEKELDRSTPDELAAGEDMLNLLRWSDVKASVPESTGAGLKCAGDLLAQQRRIPTALSKYDQAVQLSPDNYLVRFSVAQSLERYQQKDKAAQVYAEVIQSFPLTAEAAESRRGLIGLHVDNGQYDVAWKQCVALMANTVSERDRDLERRRFVEAFQKRFKHEELLQYIIKKCQSADADATSFRLLTDLYLWEGNRGKALAALRAASFKFPDNDVLRSLLVDQLTLDARQAEPKSADRTRKFNEAVREAERLAKGNPQQPYYWSQLAFVHWFQGGTGLNDALAIAQDLVKRYPEDPDSYTVLATIYLDRVQEPSSALANYQKALEMGTSYTERHEEVFFIRQGLAAIAQQDQAIEKVLQQYQRSLQRSAGSQERVGLYTALMTIFSKNGRLDRAVDYLQRLLKTNYPADEKQLVMNLVFSSVGKKKEFDEMLRSNIDRQLQANPEDAYWNLLDAVLKIALGQQSAGLEVYQKAARLAPGDATLSEWLANWHFTLGDYPSALREYERTLRLDPSRSEAFMRQAICLFKTGQSDKPSEVARQMMLRIPNDADAFQSLGTLYRECDRAPEAVEAFKEAANIATHDSKSSLDKVIWIQFDLANALVGAGNVTQAESVLRQLTLRQCGTVNRIAAYRLLSQFYESQKRVADARRALTDAISIATADKTKEELKQQLNRLAGPQ